MPVSFTFDVEPHDRIEAAAGLTCPAARSGDYAQRMDASTRWLLDTLAGHGVRATFFVVGQIAATHPRLVRAIAAAGHEVACHCWDHRRVHHFTPATFRRDVRRAKNALEQAAGQPVVGVPGPDVQRRRRDGLGDRRAGRGGVPYDSSCFPVRHDRYGVPDAPRFPFRIYGREQTLLELPPATLGVGGFNLPAAGGGYFRLFPPMVMRPRSGRRRSTRTGCRSCTSTRGSSTRTSRDCRSAEPAGSAHTWVSSGAARGFAIS